MRICVYEAFGPLTELVEKALKTLFILGYDVVIVHYPCYPWVSHIRKFSEVRFASLENSTKFCATLSVKELAPIWGTDAIYLWGSAEEVTAKISAFAGMRSDEVTYCDSTSIEEIALRHK